nr:PilI type IV pilus biogenesis protein [Salmonella enterica]
MNLPDVSARQITASWWYYATTDFCSDWNVPPAAHCYWHKGSSSRHQHLQDWLS